VSKISFGQKLDFTRKDHYEVHTKVVPHKILHLTHKLEMAHRSGAIEAAVCRGGAEGDRKMVDFFVDVMEFLRATGGRA
jgi:hypothetical protein